MTEVSDELRDKAEAVRLLVEQRPVGMRASSGVWLRGQVSALARDVVALTDRLGVQAEQIAALQEALRDSERWIHRVAGSELHSLYGHTEPYPTCGDSMCLRARRHLNLANAETPESLRRAALALAEGCAAPAPEEEK